MDELSVYVRAYELIHIGHYKVVSGEPLNMEVINANMQLYLNRARAELEKEAEECSMQETY